MPVAVGAEGPNSQRTPRWRRLRYLLPVAILVALGLGAAVVVAQLLGERPEDHAVALVPADATAYATVHLDPSLGQKLATKGVLDSAREAGAGDGTPGSLEELVATLVEELSPLEYERDLRPQLGDQLAVFAREDEPATLLAATEDPRASLQALRAWMRDEFSDDYYRIVSATHRGVPYEQVIYAVDGEPLGWTSAFTIVDDFVVVGSESGVRAAIDAREGESLAGSEEFATLRDRLSGDVLAAAYVDPRPLAEAVSDSYIDAGTRTALEWWATAGPTAATLYADDDDFQLDLAPSTPSGEAAPLRDSDELLASMPAEAVAAISLGDLEGPLRGVLEGDQTERAADLRDAVDDVADIDLSSEVVSWLGAVGAYASGEDEDTFEAGVVAETRSPAGSDGVLDRIESEYSSDEYDEYAYYDETTVYPSDDGLGFEVEELGEVLQVRGDEDRVIVGAGPSGFSTEAALDVDGGFGDSEAYGRAADLLDGYEPFLVIDAPATRHLVAQLTGAYDDEDYLGGLGPWLESLDTVAAGVRGDDDQIRLRMVADIR